MRKHNAENERVKREYVGWLRNAGGRSDATVDMAIAAIHRFEAHTGYRSFKGFRREQAISFKQHLADQTNAATGKPLSKATLYSTLKALRAFFEWLSREPGYRSAVHVSDAAYFNPTENDARVATAARERPAPSLEQVGRVLETMPTETVVERRDRALVAFILLTGARDAAVASMRLKHIDLASGRVFQDAREVKTKRAKTFTSVFFPVGEEVRRIVADWIGELRAEHLFGPDDPAFPATRMGVDAAGLFAPHGLTREPWTSAAPIRAVFRRAFERAGLPYHNPHSLRRTLMRLAYDLNLTPRELKAWSQNLGHESMLTSLVSYGGLSVEEQARVIGGIGGGRDPAPEEMAELRRLAAKIAGVGAPL